LTGWEDFSQRCLAEQYGRGMLYNFLGSFIIVLFMMMFLLRSPVKP